MGTDCTSNISYYCYTYTHPVKITIMRCHIRLNRFGNSFGTEILQKTDTKIHNIQIKKEIKTCTHQGKHHTKHESPSQTVKNNITQFYEILTHSTPCFRKKTGRFAISSYLCFDSYKLHENFQKYIGGVACCEYGINVCDSLAILC